MIKFCFILLWCFVSFFANAQNDVKGNKEVYYGNKAYDKGDLKTAVSQYQKGLQVNPKNDAARINLALTQSKLLESEKAAQNFDMALNSSKNNPTLSAMLNYDKGVSLSKAKKYEDAVKAFENSLRVNPEDKNARENLQKALNELKKQQQQNQQNKQNKDNKNQQQQNKDQQPKDKQDQQKKQQQQQNQMSQQQQNQMSQQQAEQLLKALRDQEKETQKKLDAQKAGGGIPKNGKDW